jgi:hypothetical protein
MTLRGALPALLLASALTSCAGSRAPAGAPWFAASPLQMSPSVESIDLLYVSSNERVVIFSYPLGKRVATLLGFQDPGGLCVDSAGNVFIPNLGRSNIFVYAHGAKAPKAILRDPNEQPYDCSIDPVTGNLAVANSHGTISLYAGAKGTPKTYGNPRFSYMFFLGYDKSGNLFVDGQNSSGEFEFAELPKGAKRLVNITLDQQIQFPGGVLWDGTYVAIGDQATAEIHRFAISSGHGTQKGLLHLDSIKYPGQFWIQGTRVMADDAASGDVLFWPYPHGGRPKQRITGMRDPIGVTVSLATQ